MIRFDQVSKRFADGTTAVDALDLSIHDGELTVLVGPSGCGKTTSLRLINRLEEATTGRITVGDRPIDAVDATELRRGIGYVMQHSGLFPHRTIADNIATVPRLLGWSKADVQARVDELITLVGLDAALGRRYPHQLSGGQQQRVGVARALAADPPILLMDEPFAAVDPIVRTRLQDELLALQARLHKTIVFVTHDIDEAIRLGDRIAIFATGGRLAQYATPADLLAYPADDFVADFLGGERDLKRLALIKAAEAPVMTDAPIVSAAADDEAVAAAARTARTDWVVRGDDAGAPGAWQRLSDGARGDFDAVLAPGDSLRRALSLIAISPVGVVPRVDAAGRLDGLIGQPEIRAALARNRA